MWFTYIASWCGGTVTDLLATAQSACYTYSASADVWTPTAANMNTARCQHGMALYKGRITLSLFEFQFAAGRVLVYGGRDLNGASLASVEMLAADGAGKFELAHGRGALGD